MNHKSRGPDPQKNLLSTSASLWLVLLLCLVPVYFLGYCVSFYSRQSLPLDIWLVEKKDYNGRRQYPEMAEAYQKLLQKYPDRNDLRYLLAWAHYKLGHFRQARQLVQEYVRVNPYYPAWQKQYIDQMTQETHEKPS